MGWVWVCGTEGDVVGEAREARLCRERMWRGDRDKRVSVVVLVEWWRMRNGFLSRTAAQVMQVPEVAELNHVSRKDTSHRRIYAIGILTHKDVVSASSSDIQWKRQ